MTQGLAQLGARSSDTTKTRARSPGHLALLAAGGLFGALLPAPVSADDPSREIDQIANELAAQVAWVGRQALFSPPSSVQPVGLSTLGELHSVDLIVSDTFEATVSIGFAMGGTPGLSLRASGSISALQTGGTVSVVPRSETIMLMSVSTTADAASDWDVTLTRPVDVSDDAALLLSYFPTQEGECTPETCTFETTTPVVFIPLVNETAQNQRRDIWRNLSDLEALCAAA